MRLHFPAGRIPILSFLLLIAALAPTAPLRAATDVTADIATDSTWNKTGSPYVIRNSVNVLLGATLAVQPGVTVQFDAGTGLWVYGKLHADGNPTEGILFTGSVASAGSWEAIGIIGAAPGTNSGSRFRYATIEYGGNYYGNLYLSDASAKVQRCVVRDSGGSGIYGNYGGRADVYNTSFQNNANYAILFDDGSMNPVLSSLTATGNNHNVVGLGAGTLTGSHIWESCGIPYRITSGLDLHKDATLQIKPGNTVQFDGGTALDAYGALISQGTASEPILITGSQQTPGWWEGISFIGVAGANNSGSVLSHTTVEYGGGFYGNLYIDEAQVAISDCTIRHSSTDGIYVYYGGISSAVERCKILSNAGYGIQNYSPTEPANMLLAANNWWGQASGPAHAACNPGGSGSAITDGIAFLPYLTAADASPSPVAPADARLLSILPLKWFGKSDGVTPLWVRLKLMDGKGNPLGGRRLFLYSTLGDVLDGGITGFNGETMASVTSAVAGDALLTASLDLTSGCENARSPTAKVTFQPTVNENPLSPDQPAPYLDGSVQISPLPITRGVPTVISVDLVNPTNSPITVDVNVAVGDFGIGQAFQGITTVNGTAIPAGGSGRVSAPWTPSVSGHYCARLTYSATSDDNSWSVSGETQQNLSVEEGALGSGKEKEILKKARKAIGIVNHDMVTVGMNLSSPAAILFNLFLSHTAGALIEWQFKMAEKISIALTGDPPRQDYKTFDVPARPVISPVQPGGQLTAARADAINRLMDALLDANTAGRAAAISLDRYGGASAAGDLLWASKQAAALIHYKKGFGAGLLEAADRMDALMLVVQNEGTADVLLTEDQVTSYQLVLAAQGFSQTEIDAAHQLGFSDAEIEATRQEILAQDPGNMTLSRMSYNNEVAAAFRELGQVLIDPPNFPSGAGSAKAGGAANRLARVFESSNTFQVRNPQATQATIDLRLRRVNIPGDWMLDVTPSQITLAPGAATSATLTVRAGPSAVQGTQPRAAVEAFINNQPIGGVAVDVLVPLQSEFGITAKAGTWYIYR